MLSILSVTQRNLIEHNLRIGDDAPEVVVMKIIYRKYMRKCGGHV